MFGDVRGIHSPNLFCRCFRHLRFFHQKLKVICGGIGMPREASDYLRPFFYAAIIAGMQPERRLSGRNEGGPAAPTPVILAEKR